MRVAAYSGDSSVMEECCHIYMQELNLHKPERWEIVGSWLLTEGFITLIV